MRHSLSTAKAYLRVLFPYSGTSRTSFSGGGRTTTDLCLDRRAAMSRWPPGRCKLCLDVAQKDPHNACNKACVTSWGNSIKMK